VGENKDTTLAEIVFNFAFKAKTTTVYLCSSNNIVYLYHKNSSEDSIFGSTLRKRGVSHLKGEVMFNRRTKWLQLNPSINSPQEDHTA